MKSAIIVVILVMFAAPALAVTYEWTDNQGTVNFTEDLGSIPKEFRKKAKVVGEEEAAPAAVEEGSEGAPEVKGKEAAPEPSAGEKKELNKTYGGRSPESWRAEFADLHARIKAEEDQLSDLNERIKDTSHMSRGEYISIQLGIKSSEARLKRLRERLDALTSEANRAGLPADQR